eukprot:COSAG01_NODE_8541_length_2748_cov_3.504719_1_plen_44_part_10
MLTDKVQRRAQPIDLGLLRHALHRDVTEILRLEHLDGVHVQPLP